MALLKKKVKIVKKKPVAKQEVAATKTKKVVKKKAAPSAAATKKKAVVKKKATAGKGKYPYEPCRAKKNVGNVAKNAILQGKDGPAVLEAVMEAFPESNITNNSVGYYRNALKKEGYEY